MIEKENKDYKSNSGSKLFVSETNNLHVAQAFYSLKEAAVWASKYLGKNVTTSNISYLIQYGKIKKYDRNGNTQIKKDDLLAYYQSYNGTREIEWRNKLGDDLNWALSFDHLKESDTTKHVHRLHPYKGKFIPQLVEYFLDNHIDTFKKRAYFTSEDIILDPFAGSGTTLVEANELSMHAVGVDISAFNALMNNCKIEKYNFADLQLEIERISNALEMFIANTNTREFEEALLRALSEFNNTYFPVPEFKYRVQRKQIDGMKYGEEKAQLFSPIYNQLVTHYQIELIQPAAKNFLEKWYTKHIRNEIDCVFNEIKKCPNIATKKILCIILSRTMRSCRATTHADLATLKEPVTSTYYCSKHGKICKPLFSILKWWKTYCKDTLRRLQAFDKIRTNTFQYCLAGDSRTINLFEAIAKIDPSFSMRLQKQKIRGIFSSPPYVGLIDYHEQHAYAYDLFGFTRQDDLEIGPLYKGQGIAAQQLYVQGITDVLNNCKKYMMEDYDVFLVANDKYNLYPQIAERAGMQIVERFRRPVLNRTEKDKGAYSEIIFHFKQKKNVSY